MSISVGLRTMAVTELEGTVLGVVGATGPCTPYVIRRVFQESPSTYWSGSAGAIYPLVVRLERRGLLHARRQLGDGRGGKLYRLTSDGRRALRRWMGPPCADITVGVPPDPLRTRVDFLHLLDPAARRAFLADAESKMLEHLERIHAYSARQLELGDRTEYLVSQGSARMMQARLDWLREVVRELTD
jgi:DNA-binding PadR family transcriptional regulator